MSSPFSGIAENATLIFYVPTGSLSYDSLGNAVAATAPIPIVVKLKTQSAYQVARTEKQPGIDEAAILFEGICINPMILDARVLALNWADCIWNRQNGYFHLNAPINPPHGRDGIGAIIEPVLGTTFTGWFQEKRGS